MRKETGIKAADVAKLKFSKLIQGFRWKGDDLPFTNALSGFILAKLSLGSCQQTIRLITVFWYPCMFVHVSVPVHPVC